MGISLEIAPEIRNFPSESVTAVPSCSGGSGPEPEKSMLAPVDDMFPDPLASSPTKFQTPWISRYDL